MSKNAVVSLTLQVKGNADQKIKQMADAQVKAVKQINTESQKLKPIQEGQVQTAKKILSELQKQGTALTQQSKEAKAVELSRKLGLRTEQQIKSEIQQTQAVYQKLGILQRQGVITTKDMERSYAAMKNKVASLNAELGKTAQKEKQIQQVQRQGGSNGQRLQNAALIGGTVVGAGMMLQQPIKRTIDYDRDLHYASQKLSDTSGDWKDTKKWMNTIVVGNAINGGVSRDQSFLAMESLIANGAYSDNNLGRMKGNLSKAHYEAAKSALASGGDILDFAKVGLAAKSRGLDEGRVQAMVIKADDLGAMGANDLAKELPAQMGKLPVDKVNGERQVAQLVALNEMAMNTAGTASEAATNVNNFLGKMYSDDTNKRLKKDYSIDLPQRYAEGKNQGKTDFDVFSEVVDQIIAKDKNMQDIVTKLAAAKTDDERKAILETQQAIFEQSGLAKIFPDMQALMALVASKRYSGGWEAMTQAALTEGEKARDTKYEYNKKELPAYGTNAFDVSRLNAEFSALEGTIGILGEMGTKVAELNEKYPTLITAMGTAELALKTLAVAAGGAAIGQVITGKKGEPPLVADGKPAAKAPSKAKSLVKGAGAAGVAYAGYEAISWIDDHLYSVVDKILGGTGEKKDFVQEAIEKSIAQQAQLNSQLIAKQDQNNQLLGTLIDATRANKPVFVPGGTLADAFGRTQENRHGAPKPFMLQHTGR